MSNFSRHQEKIIKNYYNNREAISLQRAQEILTELYLTEGKKRERQWDSLMGHLEKLGVGQETRDFLRKEDDPQKVATLLQKLLAKK